MNYLASHLPKGEKIYAKTHKSAFIFMRDVLIAVLLFLFIVQSEGRRQKIRL